MEEVDIQEAFGDKIPFHPNNLVRKQRKSSRSPINPVDLDHFKSGVSSKQELGHHDLEQFLALTLVVVEGSHIQLLLVDLGRTHMMLILQRIQDTHG